MQELVTRQRYWDILLTEMPTAFPWVKEAKLIVLPGHIHIAYRYLRDIESIVGQEALNEKLRFLRLIDTEEMGFRAFIEVEGLSEVRASAVHDAGAAAAKASRLICATCGMRTEHHDGYCSAHRVERMLFTDDAPVVPSPAKNNKVETGVVDIFAEAVADQKADPHFESQRLEVPKLVVFSEEDVAQLEKSADGKDSDTRDRIRGVVKKVREVEGTKPLALVPVGWREKLDQFETDFPNFAEFVEFLRDRFALAELGDRSIDIPPVLFDGPPGIGKTEVALSFATLIDTGSMELDMAVAQSGAALSGSEAFWTNTREGRLFETLVYGRTANPLVFLDELDKVGSDERYRPDAALYQLLEPRTAESFRDLSVREMKLNASRVLWFAASNALERVPQPIVSRFVVFNIPAPTSAQCKTIAHSIYRRLIARSAWGAAMASGLSDDVAGRLAELAPREMRIKLSQACGRAARQGRREVQVEDIAKAGTQRKQGIGFIWDTA